MKKQTTEKKVELGNIGEIELPKIDITKYIGKNAEIESVDTYQGEFGYYVKVLTVIVETIGKGDNKIELRGSKVFGLQTDETGTLGYGKDTKLGLFLQKMKCEKISDLVGKQIILQSQTNSSGTDFLSFN